MKRKELLTGDIVNNYNIKYVKDIYIENKNSLRKRRKCLFECHCGVLFESILSDVSSDKRTSCGCRKGNKAKCYKNGDVINGVIFLKSLGVKNLSQRAIFLCPICNKEWDSLICNVQSGNSKSCCGKKRGWSKSQWVNYSKNSILYKVVLYNNEEEFIKIGITSVGIEKRFKYIPYKYKVVKTIYSNSEYIYDLENRINRFFKRYKYNPKIKFNGDTECFIIKK